MIRWFGWLVESFIGSVVLIIFFQSIYSSTKKIMFGPWSSVSSNCSINSSTIISFVITGFSLMQKCTWCKPFEYQHFSSNCVIVIYIWEYSHWRRKDKCKTLLIQSTIYSESFGFYRIAFILCLTLTSFIGKMMVFAVVFCLPLIVIGSSILLYTIKLQRKKSANNFSANWRLFILNYCSFDYVVFFILLKNFNKLHESITRTVTAIQNRQNEKHSIEMHIMHEIWTNKQPTRKSTW